MRASITIFRDITNRKVVAARLEQAHDSLEQKVIERTHDLEEANTALRVLVKGNDEDRILMEKKILSNAETLLLPYIEKIKQCKLNENLTSYVKILESNLKDITSPFSEKLSSKLLKLTPTEIRITNLVRQGLTTKEIARIMSLSVETIGTHRKKVRKKIGLKNKKANLQTYLLSI
jgi:DNA-binding CsgD family transcriptional regulator